MKSHRTITLIIACLVAAPCLARPPKVIKMIPENGATDVKPGPAKIRILFDQDMTGGQNYSICGSGENFPEIIGKPRWTGKRSFMMNVNLKPDHDYSFGINCPAAQNFKSVKGEPAEILFVSFRTGSENGTQAKNVTEQKTPIWKCIPLLDSQTQSRLSEFEQYVSNSYQYPQKYKNASDAQKAMFEKKWIKDLHSNKQDPMIAAAIHLGMIKAQSAAEPLEKILSTPSRNGRLKWTCTRALGQIGSKTSIPVLINLLDDYNIDTCIYARVSLAEITGVYFGKDKNKWMKWHNDPSSVTYTKIDTHSSIGSHQAAIAKLLDAIDNKYSYKEEKKIDWDELFKKYYTSLSNANSAKDFAKTAGLMLAHAKDKHIWLKVNGEHISAYRNRVTPNANFQAIPNIVPSFKKHNNAVFSGKFPSGIGYISINNWSHRNKEDFNQLYVVLKKFSNAPGLIIDVRGNSGGSETLAQEFAGCFIDKSKLYAKHVYRDVNSSSGFGKHQKRILKPNRNHRHYRGKVAVLSGPVVMSSCEAFVLMMKQVPDCTIIGEPTRGSSGNPKPHDLGNGVTVYLPSWKALLPDGTCFEGKGIQPDILVKTTQQEIATSDPVIEAARKALKEKIATTNATP